jgi:hypothetical protein
MSETPSSQSMAEAQQPPSERPEADERSPVRDLPSYEDALADVGQHSQVVSDISEQYERLVDVYDPEFSGGRELPGWQDYFVESLDLFRACGYFDEVPAPAQVTSLDDDVDEAGL